MRYKAVNSKGDRKDKEKRYSMEKAVHYEGTGENGDPM
jgi:hypothetical protein